MTILTKFDGAGLHKKRCAIADGRLDLKNDNEVSQFKKMVRIKRKEELEPPPNGYDKEGQEKMKKSVVPLCALTGKQLKSGFFQK